MLYLLYSALSARETIDLLFIGKQFGVWMTSQSLKIDSDSTCPLKSITSGRSAISQLFADVLLNKLYLISHLLLLLLLLLFIQTKFCNTVVTANAVTTL
jgi:hypothetical protein